MAFRLTLSAPDASPVSMLFEQDEVTVGRAQTNDVVVRDPKVSKAHAVIELSPTGHHVVRDRKSKNATFVEADHAETERVKPETPVLLTPGTTLHLGDSTLSYMPLVEATKAARSETARSETTDASTSPEDVPLPHDLEPLLEVFVHCVARIEAMWARSDEMAGEAVESAVERRMQTMSKAEQRVLKQMAAVFANGKSPDHNAAGHDDTWGVLPATLRDVLALPGSVWDHLKEPPSARTNPFLDAPTPAEVRTALQERTHPEQEAEAFQQLCTALQYVVVHHHAVLHGYQASIETGGQALLRRISPRESTTGAGKSGVFTRVFGGGDSGVNWERLERQWRKLYHSNWREIEEKLFRPSLLAAYREHVQHPPDANTSPLSASPSSVEETTPA